MIAFTNINIYFKREFNEKINAMASEFEFEVLKLE